MTTQRIPVNPSAAEFAAFADRQPDKHVLPLVFRMPNEGLFVWSAFAALERDNEFAFLLESAETGANGRYSFMGAAPRRLFRLKDGIFTVTDGSGQTLAEKKCADPIEDLAAQLSAVPGASDSSLPPFLSGVVGYLGYDCVHYFEPVGEMKPDMLNIPDMLWMQIDMMAVFDHYRQELYLVKNCYREDAGGHAGADWQGAYTDGRAALEALLQQMQSAPPPAFSLPPPVAPASEDTDKTVFDDDGALPIGDETGKQFYCDMVEKAKTLIRAGDIFQVVPSQRFSFPQTLSALEIYRNMRRINPSPFMFHLKCGDFFTVGSSPELMLSCQDRHLRVRPIAGTRPRGNDDDEDRALEAELRHDEKEIAEHLMLVDLGRNDLGRVAEIGSVQVPPARFCRIDRYSHVMHIVSDVDAVLAADKTVFDAARVTFPAGTLSGAPKVRAMQIINDMEPCKRNLYGGFAGYIGHNGDLLTCIVIRTLVAKDGVCHVQAGGGIVADSVPETEYQESVNKAMAALRAATEKKR